ncbi:MAG: molybdenum cofactor guanylyltransferase [Candidatus Dormiibacterota bacterium]
MFANNSPKTVLGDSLPEEISTAPPGGRLPATLALLAGGMSRRMGYPKALLPIGDTTLVEWVIGRVGPAFDEVLVTGGPDTSLPAAVRSLLVIDEFAGAGPLAGIEAALGAARHEQIVAIACDLPWATPALARRLVVFLAGHDAAVPFIEGRAQPTLAAYRRSARAALRRRLLAGQRRTIEALADLDVRWVEGEDPAAFTNCNTPADYERLRRLVAGQRP